MGLETLFYIIRKNMRLVFRNLSSFVLLVLGPMLLIFIVGFAFSGDDLHDITIGVYAPQDVDINSVVDALASDDVGVLFFSRIDRCITSMNQSRVHICADFASDFEESGEVTFYYDATRYNLVRYILEYLQQQIAITSEEISLELAKEIFADIEGFVGDMENAQIQVGDLRDNALLLREDLVAMHADVVAARGQFEPSYYRIKETQASLNSTALELSADYAATTDIGTVLADIYLLRDTLESVRTTLTAAELALAASGFDTGAFFGLYANIDQAELSIQNTIASLESTGDLSSVTLEETYALLDEMNTMVGYLDTIYINLLATEEALAQHIVGIDSGVENLDTLGEAFDSYIEEFSSITEEDAEKFLHPIAATFVGLPNGEETSKIQLVFPMLLVFMITFMSVLLSNMLVLNETHSPAYFRSFLLPVSHMYFIVGLFFTNLILIGIQMIVLLLVASVSFDVTFFLNFPVFAFSLLLTIFIFVEIGMIFGYFVHSRQTSLLLSLFFSLILFFFSDIVFPIEIMPTQAAFVAQFSPLVIAEGIFRRTLFYGHGVMEQFFGFGVLGLYAVFFGIVVVAVYYWNRSRR
jgi:ABC-type multidrug transport system permease subunit